MADGFFRGEAPSEGTAPRHPIVADVVARLLAVDPEEHALRRLVGVLAEGIPDVDAAALLVRDAEGRFEVVAQVGLDDDAPGAVDGGLAAAALDAGAARVAHAAGPPLPRGTRAAAAAPVRAGDTAGALLVGSRGADRLDDDALLLLRVAADRAALIVDRARASRGRADAVETLRRAEADLESRRKAVDFILGVVGHDLRNPLGAVHMSASLLHTKGGLSGWQARAVERARSSAGRMGRIIADLLSYTRTRLGNGIPIARRAAALDAIVRRVVDELAAVNSGRAIDIEARGDLSGEWDADRLEQVASNLVSNAIDHGEPTGPVTVELDGTAPDEVVMRVRNDGPGMPQEVIDHLFEPFSRAPDAKSRKASGLGLGLYIAREIVRGHGGRIGATSGAETVVTVALPRRAA